MKHVSVMFKPASAMCNMKCTYCFYKDVSNHREVPSYGFMSAETMSLVLRNICGDLSPGDTLTLGFQGGEPTLIGLGFYEKFVSLAKELTKGISLKWTFQTNGLIIDDNWCQFFKAHKFLIGLSLDLYGHNTNRLDSMGKGTLNRVLKTKQLFDAQRVDYNILCVLTNQTARHPDSVWKQIIQWGIRHVQFIPCLDDLDNATPVSLTPARFASFYNALIPLWYAHYKNGKYISIKWIDDIIQLLATGAVHACGLTGRCMPQYIIEADGSCYPCDFYVLDACRTGNLREGSLQDQLESENMQRFLAEKKDVPERCQHCPFAHLCNGGCKRMKNVMYGNKNDSFCGHQGVLRENWDVFATLCRPYRT